MEERFGSRLLPLFKRRTEEVGALLPGLYLHGLSLGDCDLALRGLLCDAAPLSPSSILRLKEERQEQYSVWKRRDLSDERRATVLAGCPSGRASGWNHKPRNVLDVVTKKHQPEVKLKRQKIASAETQEECERLKREFRKSYERVHPKALERSKRDWERMITYYSFPCEH